MLIKTSSTSVDVDKKNFAYKELKKLIRQNQIQRQMTVALKTWIFSKSV